MATSSRPRFVALFTSAFTVAALAACGTANHSTFSEGEETTAGNDAEGGHDSFGAPSTGGRDGGGGGKDDGGACAVTGAEVALTPVNLVVVFDRSGSMGDTNENPDFDPEKRWVPVRDAMKAFFGDAQSVGMRAALTFFPTTSDSCTADDYATPDVALASLPSDVFATTLDAAAPKGDTPTRAAVGGAITQAQAIAAQHPNDKTAIVLVTDGEPYGCGINTYEQSNAEAAEVATQVGESKVSTYVIGVGPSVQNLNGLATAGGTTAFHVEVGNPASTTSQLVAALGQIRGGLGRCDFDVPTPPDGRTLDFGKVDVELRRAGGSVETQPHVPDCAGGAGWRYDDERAPKKVVLCPATCDAVKAEAGGKVNVAFRCVDRPDVVR